MEQNNMRKYLLYALGEILLVMIGILLALQVNDWNDDRKKHEKEQEVLQQLKIELSEDLSILDEVISLNDFVILSCNTLIDHLENDLPYNDSLEIYFDRWASPNVLEFNGSTYQNLITTGPELIANKNLRNEVLKLYNYYYPKSKTFNDYFRGDFHSFIAPIQLENVEAVEWGKSSVPLDYEGLKKNTLFLNALKWTKNGHRSNNLEFKSLLGSIQKLIEMIDRELEDRFD